MTDQRRPYRQTTRARQQERTRLRITESAVELHGTLGPSRTSMSAVAQHAGVRRSTLYRHFPDETALFAACSGHWAAQNPLPDLEQWAAIQDPDKRLRTALTELYAFYERAEPMLSNLLRDLDLVDGVRQQFAGFLDYVRAAHATLCTGRKGSRRVRRDAHAAVGHALAFTTWRSLVRDQGCTRDQAIGLMCRLAAS